MIDPARPYTGLDPYASAYDDLTARVRRDFALNFAITDPRSAGILIGITEEGRSSPPPEADPPRLIRVHYPRSDHRTDQRTRQGWIANDFRAGIHPTRAGALRAWKRKRKRTG